MPDTPIMLDLKQFMFFELPTFDPFDRLGWYRNLISTLVPVKGYDHQEKGLGFNPPPQDANLEIIVLRWPPCVKETGMPISAKAFATLHLAAEAPDMNPRSYDAIGF
jgi:hypothetical protein